MVLDRFLLCAGMGLCVCVCERERERPHDRGEVLFEGSVWQVHHSTIAAGRTGHPAYCIS